MSSTAKRDPRDFGFGSDEEMLRDLARKFLDEQMPIERLREIASPDPEQVYARGERPGWDEGLWKQSVELGWTGLAVPEAAGGLGFKLAGIAGLVEEVGRHALPSPIVATICSTLLLRECELDTRAAWLGRIADGSAISLATTNARGSWEPGDCDVSARAAADGDGTAVSDGDGDGFTLDGTAAFVQDAYKVDHLLVQARCGDETIACVVARDADGVTLEQNHIHDLTRDQATLQLRGVRVAPDCVVSRDATRAIERAWPSVLVVVSADLCGNSEWQLQTTAEYARNRKQFEHTLGFFQAVKHPLVNAMVAIDRARSLLYHAACCIDVGSEEAEQAARMAKSAASDAAAFMSDRSVQLHGGIGFTWECDVHLYFKRSLHNQTLYGDGTHQRRKLADTLIGPTQHAPQAGR